VGFSRGGGSRGEARFSGVCGGLGQDFGAALAGRLAAEALPDLPPHLFEILDRDFLERAVFFARTEHGFIPLQAYRGGVAKGNPIVGGGQGSAFRNEGGGEACQICWG